MTAHNSIQKQPSSIRCIRYPKDSSSLHAIKSTCYVSDLPTRTRQPRRRNMPSVYQSSHSSSFFAPPGPLLDLPMADVPIELYLAPVPCLWSATEEKSSQNALLVSSIPAPPAPPARLCPSGPSTNRLKPSWAVRAPCCAAFPTLPAATLACAAKSDSEICGKQY